MKQCRKCQQEKPDADFNKQLRNRDGLQSYCKLCGAASSRKSNQRIYLESPEKGRARAKARREADPEKARAKAKDYYHANIEKERLRWRVQGLRRYGLTVESYNELLASQNGVCLVCKQEETGKALAVDHCHITGKIRGLLCCNCNRAIGYLEDDPDRAEELAKYLE